ncbi:MAG: hypothetical protein HDS68_00805 [Bacteroidales bacterium]|nr:hypothetical protein [Bacteroidales bacterium]
MKDITFSARRQKTELWYLLGAFVVANLVNLWAITSYGAPIKEMFTSFFYVLTFTVFLYALSVIVRIVVYGIRSLIVNRKKLKTNNSL